MIFSRIHNKIFNKIIVYKNKILKREAFLNFMNKIKKNHQILLIRTINLNNLKKNIKKKNKN